ncbi:SKP1-like protein 1A [Morella rubra]|uniref:SKP1-like protein n=1 Tax=Morella rubra TaxID=262757 RepID=A0A6A1UE93_9ROSI|nr:SKP1-like protein 1A [Morella rubra]
MADDGARKITMRTAEGQVFEVDEAVAMEFQTVKSFFEDDSVSYDSVIPLPNVSTRALSRVVFYCKRSLDFGAKSAAAIDEDDKKKAKEEREAFEVEFVRDEDDEEIKELVLAANYLNIKDMLDSLNQSVANRIQNKSVEYVRRFFGIENDFTPEEEAQIRQENAWAFEGVDDDDWYENFNRFRI